MRSLSRLAFLLLLTSACGDQADAGAAVDGGRDADARDVLSEPDAFEEPDVPRVRDAGPDTSGPRVWHHEPELEVRSTECEDWDVVPRMPRALPEDATPRVLWSYRPGLDPLYDYGRAAGFSYVGEQPVVSPDGTVWVQGPRAAHVTQLSRDGRMRRWFWVGGQDENDPEIQVHLARQLLALPDGVVVAAVYSMHPDYPMGYLARMNPDQPFPGLRDDDALDLPVFNERPQLAAGPGGMVYALSGDRLYATCKAQRLMWTLTNVAGPEAPLDRSLSHVFVEPDGSVVVSGGAERAYRVRPGAEEVEAFPAIEVGDGELFQFGLMTPERSLALAYDGTHVRIELIGSDPVVRFSRIESAGLSPMGRIVFWEDGPRFIDPPYDTEPETFESVGTQKSSGARWFEDGDWIQSNAGLVRRTGSGEMVWQVEGGIGGNGALDDQGVYFGTREYELVAVQTDGLPPALTMCVEHGCNAHRDHWIRPE